MGTRQTATSLLHWNVNQIPVLSSQSFLTALMLLNDNTFIVWLVVLTFKLNNQRRSAAKKKLLCYVYWGAATNQAYVIVFQKLHTKGFPPSTLNVHLDCKQPCVKRGMLFQVLVRRWFTSRKTVLTSKPMVYQIPKHWTVYNATTQDFTTVES